MKEVIMPRLGVTMQAGTISSWLIEEGESVEKGEYLFELETEKSTIEIEAQESGVLKKILVPEDEEVSINTVIAIIGEGDEEIDLSKYENQNNDSEDNKEAEKEVAAATQVAETPKSNDGQIKIIPRARKLAKELGIAIETVVGTGKDGLITEKDIQNATSTTVNGSDGLQVKEKISLNNVKKKMAENMANSWRTIPQFTQVVSVNMENVLKVKKELDGVTVNDLLVKTVGNAVSEYSIVNSKLEGNEVIVYEDVNVCVAINSEQGLVVPVVKNVEKKSVQEVSKEIKALGEKAQTNTLSINDFSYGTITVSNLGSLGIETGTPIINMPQSTLVFAGAITKVPVVNENDQIVIAPIMKLSVTYDHRFIDGVTAAQFTNNLKNALETLTVDHL
ncbi:dihydrolipoamide acetyltransferase family protein [Alkalihalobacterium alkalinitrilicum]|uniref:dihydrolipoamide acetyltransferase family protein n=1 Tax=Alkalihalobacterium alkalinitrilicum TaxID=427920 RepID=UPI000995B7EE|nr:dihydrolipoamide acetyltransferase family protein [Alkalihalobacterium alkalinitrilicum]